MLFLFIHAYPRFLQDFNIHLWPELYQCCFHFVSHHTMYGQYYNPTRITEYALFSLKSPYTTYVPNISYAFLSYGFPPMGFPMVPMVCFAHGFPRVFPTFPRVFRFLCFSYGFSPFFPHGFPYVFPGEAIRSSRGNEFRPRRFFVDAISKPWVPRQTGKIVELSEKKRKKQYEKYMKNMKNIWKIYGKYMKNIWKIWNIYGKYMKNMENMEYIWNIFGNLENIWNIYGEENIYIYIYMEHIWKIYDKYMEHNMDMYGHVWKE